MVGYCRDAGGGQRREGASSARRRRLNHLQGSRLGFSPSAAAGAAKCERSINRFSCNASNAQPSERVTEIANGGEAVAAAKAAPAAPEVTAIQGWSTVP